MGRWSIILERSARPLGLYLALCSIFVIAFTLVRATALEYVYPLVDSTRPLKGEGGSNWAFMSGNEDVLSTELFTIVSTTFFGFVLASFGFYPIVPDTSRSPAWNTTLFTILSGNHHL